MSNVIAFRTPGAPPPRDPPVWLPAVPPVKRPKPIKSGLTSAQQREAVGLLTAFAADMGMVVTITVHPQGGVA